jgi:hypothetical protein
MEQQYRLYICMNQFGEPPRIGYAVEEFASQGEVAARFLAAKLSDSSHQKTTLSILRIYVEMTRRGTFDVAADPDLATLLDAKVREVSYPEYRRLAQDWLDEIRRQRSDNTRPRL